MALFQGDEIVDVTTPDGRTLKLPRSIVPASLLPQPAPQQIAPLATGATVYNAPEVAAPEDEFGSAPSVTGGQIPSDPLAQTPETAPPTPKTLKPITVDTQALAKQQAAQQKAAAKQRKAQLAYAASPQGQMAGAAQQTQNAIADEQEATIAAADVDAAAQDMAAGAYAERNKQLDDLFAKRAADAQAGLEEEQKQNDAVVAMRKKIAGTKIDRKADHPILAAISIALAGLGSAMKGESTNPALEMFWRAIDRKVANQMADLDLMEKTYGMSKDELGMLKERNNRKLELHNILIAGEVDKAQRHLEEIVAKSASEKTRANAKILAAQIAQRGAQAHQDAVRWGLEYNQRDAHHKAQMGVAWFNAKENQRSNMAGEQLKREDMYLDYQKALAADKARGDEAAYKARLEAIKDVRQLGIKGPDNHYLLTPAGRAKMDQAVKLEAEAESLLKGAAVGTEGIPTPEVTQQAQARAAMLREKAAILRGDAQTIDVVQGRDPNQAGVLSNTYAAAQGMVDTIDEIKALYDQADRRLISESQLHEAIQAKVGLLAVAGKEAWQLGAWDNGSAKLTEKIIGQDPTSEWNVGMLGAIWKQQAIKDPEGFKQRLESVVTQLEQGVRLKIAKNSTWDGQAVDKMLTRKLPPDPNDPRAKASAAISGGRTPVEAETAAAPSTGGKVRDAVYSFGGLAGEPQYKVNQREAANSGSTKHIGLSPEQAQGFDTLLQSYKGGNARDGEMLVEKIVAEAATRPDLATPLAQALREHAPDLYAKARMRMPKDSETDKRLTYQETNQIGVAQIPTDMLAQQIRASIDRNGKVTDEEGWRELARRAKTDKVAGAAKLDLLRSIGVPQNSVFRGGR